jgi:hypothetical protein
MAANVANLDFAAMQLTLCLIAATSAMLFVAYSRRIRHKRTKALRPQPGKMDRTLCVLVGAKTRR